MTATRIGVFDSGHGGLTIVRTLAARFPQQPFIYLGDHANAPYGERSHAEIVALTQAGCARLFALGCQLVLLGCNTATAVAGRTLQQTWVPTLGGRKILGIVAPTVEAATQTPWSQTVPTFPQAYNRDVIGLFATSATVESGVYAEEIAKRCPSVRMVAQGCPALVPLLERGASATELHVAVHGYVQQLLAKCAALEANLVPNLAILGCTHYPLIKPLFMQALPPSVRVFDQPQAVADALDDYLTRHPEFATPLQSGGPAGGGVRYYTTGEAAQVQRIASLLLKQAIEFYSLT